VKDLSVSLEASKANQPLPRTTSAGTPPDPWYGRLQVATTSLVHSKMVAEVCRDDYFKSADYLRDDVTVGSSSMPTLKYLHWLLYRGCGRATIKPSEQTGFEGSVLTSGFACHLSSSPPRVPIRLGCNGSTTNLTMSFRWMVFLPPWLRSDEDRRWMRTVGTARIARRSVLSKFYYRTTSKKRRRQGQTETYSLVFAEQFAAMAVTAVTDCSCLL
jgi:hypothetical protein